MDAHRRRRHLTRVRAQFRDRSLTVLLAVQVCVIFGFGPLLSLGFPMSPTIAGSVLVLVIFAVVVAAPNLVPMIAVVAALLFNAAAALALQLPGASTTAYWMDAVGATLSIVGISWVVISGRVLPRADRPARDHRRHRALFKCGPAV